MILAVSPIKLTIVEPENNNVKGVDDVAVMVIFVVISLATTVYEFPPIPVDAVIALVRAVARSSSP